MKILTLLPLFLCLLGRPSLADEDEGPVRIVGSGTIARPLSLAIPILNDRGIIAKIFAGSGSTASIEAVGEGAADIALSIRPLNGEDRAPFPERILHEQLIGYQAVALIVPSAVWESGVHALTKEQIQRIYEGEITNWKDLGGKDRPIKFLNPEQGVGVWELFATWLYGELTKAPLGSKFETVKGGADTRDLVEFSEGALSVVPVMYADNKGVFGLAIQGEKGEPVAPTDQNVCAKRYPLQRPLILVVAGTPTGNLRKVLEFMTAPEGQALVKKSDFVPLPPK
jgi:phosphate transport system substrate-binding protein